MNPFSLSTIVNDETMQLGSQNCKMNNLVLKSQESIATQLPIVKDMKLLVGNKSQMTLVRICSTVSDFIEIQQ